MAKSIQRLTAMAVTHASKSGLYPDGGGLYLRVARNGSKSWAFRYTLNGRPHEMGLGGLTKVASLMRARRQLMCAARSVTGTIRSHSARRRKRVRLLREAVHAEVYWSLRVASG